MMGVNARRSPSTSNCSALVEESNAGEANDAMG